MNAPVSHRRLDQNGINNGYATIIHHDPCRYLLNEALNRKICKNKKVIILNFTLKNALHFYVGQVFQRKSCKKRLRQSKYCKSDFKFEIYAKN